jgi:hypothetical protein
MRLTTSNANSSLHQFTQKVKNKRDEIVEYPKVKGDRDPNNPLHWQFQVTWKEKINGEWKSRCRSVPPRKAAWVRKAIVENLGIKQIQEYLTLFDINNKDS